MRIHHVHPKFLGDALLQEEHDFLHRLFDALSEGGKADLDHPDLFRFRGKRGCLYVRHRRIAEELGTRGIPHGTALDRREIDPEEWREPEAPSEEVLEDARAVGEGQPGRVPLPDSTDPEDFTCPGEICSAVPGVTDLEILRGLWRIYRYAVMERSYGRYRSLADPVQGRGRGSVWMLFDLMMEEAMAQVPEEKAPAIAYGTIWEILEEKAAGPEKEEYARLSSALEPGKFSLEMRRFLAGAAARQENRDLTVSALLGPYMETE